VLDMHDTRDTYQKPAPKMESISGAGFWNVPRVLARKFYIMRSLYVLCNTVCTASCCHRPIRSDLYDVLLSHRDNKMLNLNFRPK